MTTRIESARHRPVAAEPPRDLASRDAARRLASWIESSRSTAFLGELFRKKTCAERPDACVPIAEARPELFVQGDPNEVDAIDPRDVKQNRVGDCYLLASLQALAQTARGRARLREIVKEKRDAAGLRYEVTFHVPKRFYERGPPLKPKTITIEPRFIEAGAHRTATGSGATEVWVAVIEAAYAKLNGSYAAIDGGRCESALAALTGNVATTTSDPAALEPALLAGRPVCMWFFGKNLDAHAVRPRHAYAVAAITRDASGRVFVQLRNPWGHHHPPPIPLDILSHLGAEAAIGDMH
jgi:hypothetical protein